MDRPAKLTRLPAGTLRPLAARRCPSAHPSI